MKSQSIHIPHELPEPIELQPGDLPIHHLTPGHIASQDPEAVLQPGYARANRRMPQILKEAVFRRYRIPWSLNWRYEVDHLVPLSLGGSNDIRNLWPHSLSALHPPRLKMRLERKLRQLVRQGALSLREAQVWLKGNWVMAFYRFCRIPPILA